MYLYWQPGLYQLVAKYIQKYEFLKLHTKVKSCSVYINDCYLSMNVSLEMKSFFAFFPTQIACVSVFKYKLLTGYVQLQSIVTCTNNLNNFFMKFYAAVLQSFKDITLETFDRSANEEWTKFKKRFM